MSWSTIHILVRKIKRTWVRSVCTRKAPVLEFGMGPTVFLNILNTRHYIILQLQYCTFHTVLPQMDDITAGSEGTWDNLKWNSNTNHQQFTKGYWKHYFITSLLDCFSRRWRQTVGKRQQLQVLNTAYSFVNLCIAVETMDSFLLLMIRPPVFQISVL